MDHHSIERPGSPLYEAIREILSGQWPEDEYDVTEQPLSYVDYKSQVCLDIEEAPEPVPDPVASDTDSESVKSDGSTWSRAEGADDTVATDINIDIGVRERPNTEYTDLLSGFEDGVFGGSYDEIEGNEKGREQSWTETIETRRESGSTIASTDAVVGARVSVGIGSGFEPEAEKVHGDETDTELGTEVAEDDNTSVSESEANTEIATPVNARPKPRMETEIARRFKEAMGPVARGPPVEMPIVPINELVQPPPIPSRSPSRPGTASMANRKPQPETQEIFTAHVYGSTASLPPARLTVSSMSSPRSSRFFEDLGDQATTATSPDISENLTFSPPPPSRKESESFPEKRSQKPKEKKRKSGFFQSCGLSFRLWGKKPSEPKLSSGKERRRSMSITSLIKKR